MKSRSRHGLAKKGVSENPASSMFYMFRVFKWRKVGLSKSYILQIRRM